jgi:uncharacterized protein YodC (DUF2158 family)
MAVGMTVIVTRLSRGGARACQQGQGEGSGKQAFHEKAPLVEARKFSQAA